MSTMTSLDFARTARLIGIECRSRMLTPPRFRSPARSWRDPGATRTIIRHEDERTTIAVTIKGRSTADVVLDMIDGTLAAQSSDPTFDVHQALRLRTAIFEACTVAGIVS